MTPEQDIPQPAGSTPPEPGESRRAVPVWMVVLLFLLLYWGFVFFDQHSAWTSEQVYIPYHSLAEVADFQPPPMGGPDLQRGQKIFESNCALCHNTDGTGKPNQAPPFVGSEWVLGPADRMIRIPQIGLTGPIPLKGAVWSQAPAMPAMGAPLSDEDLAAVLSYIRMSWGNKASEVTADQVKAVRKAVAGRTQPWTAEELSKIP